MAITKNFAKVQVSIGYDASATSVALEAGHGARLPTSTPFWVTWWDSTLYPDPSDDPNVEVVLVTGISTDTLTVTRGQQGTSATAKDTAASVYRMVHAPTAYDHGYLPLVSSSSKVIYLDATNGHDASAQRGNPVRPYLTFATAFAQLQSGDTLRIMPGTYTITPVAGSTPGTDLAPFKIASKTDIRMEGVGWPVIYGAGDGNWFSIRDSSHIHIEGIIFRGDDVHIRAVAPNPIFAMWDIRPTDITTDVSWVNCRFENYRDHAISSLFAPKPHRRFKVLGCHFESGGAIVTGTANVDGAAVVSLGSDVLVQSCTFVNILRGIEMEGQGPHNNVIVTGCSFYKIWDIGVMIFADYGNPTHFMNLTVSNCTFEDVHAANAPAAITVSANPIYCSGGRNLKYEGNTFRNTRIAAALFCTASDLDNVSFSRNIIDNTTSYGVQIYAFNADIAAGREIKKVIVADNIITNTGSHGIRYRGRNALISGNMVFDTVGSGILLFNDGANIIDPCLIVLDGNRTGNDTTSSMTYGIEIQSNFYDAIVHGNYFGPTATAAYLDSGTATAFADNWSV